MVIIRNIILLSISIASLNLAKGEDEAKSRSVQEVNSQGLVTILRSTLNSILVLGFMMVVTAALFSSLPLTYFYGFYFGRYYIAPFFYDNLHSQTWKLLLYLKYLNLLRISWKFVLYVHRFILFYKLWIKYLQKVM